MKKGLSILLSVLLVMVLAVSFSVPVEAAGWTYVSGDVTGTINNMTSSAFATSFSGGSYSPLLPYHTGSNSLGKGLIKITIPELNYYLKQAIPGNSKICVEFGFRVWFQHSSVNVDSVSFYDLDMILDNPYSSIRLSTVQAQVSGAFDRLFRTELYFDSPASVSMVNIHDLELWVTLDSNYSSGNTVYVYPGYFRVSYYPINDNPNAGVLEQIKNNTNATKDAVNSQTDTLANGYDNSGMENSNTALSGSMNDYHERESQVTDQATSFIDGVEFIDLSAQAQLLTGITFASSFLQSLFVSLGDWGILVIFSLSVTLAFMLVGWFKFRR